jgi:hypothetical protein
VSDRESLAESHPLTQLAQLVRHAGEELASFRKRALAAEAKLREYETSAKSGDLFAEHRAKDLERENAELRARLEFATDETRAILAQVRFLRQQAERPVTGSMPAVANGRAEAGNREGGAGRRKARGAS